MQNPTTKKVRETAQTIDQRSQLYLEAIYLKDQAFNAHFKELPNNSQRDFLILRDEYLKFEESENEASAAVKRYYRIAVRRFHPDTAGHSRKVAFFREATEAYRKKGLPVPELSSVQDF